MIKATVPALAPRRMAGTSKTTGKPYDMTFQTVYFHTADKNGNPLPFPEKSEIVLDKDAQPYAPGEYTISPDSLYVDRQGNLTVAPKLVPLKRG